MITWHRSRVNANRLESCLLRKSCSSKPGKWYLLYSRNSTRVIRYSALPKIGHLVTDFLKVKWVGLLSLEVVKSELVTRNTFTPTQLDSYTGAPYFSAMASAKLGVFLLPFFSIQALIHWKSDNQKGVDMSHVICEPGAAAVIKTYSPNLMIHPLLRQSANASTIPLRDTASSLAERVIEMLPRLHVLVVGPGLGRDELMMETCTLVLTEARKRKMPFVLDADALGIVSKTPDVIKGYRECILTPNVIEFGRLAKAVGIDVGADGEGCRALAKALGGVTVIRKGAQDWISDGEDIVVSDGVGGKKRSGGQGDTLTGSLGTWLAWRKAYLDRIWEHDGSLDEKETLRLAAFAGSSLTRECSRRAFEQKGRSMQASDLTEQVHPSFITLFADDDEPGKHHL